MMIRYVTKLMAAFLLWVLSNAALAAADTGNAIKQIQVRQEANQLLMKIEMRDPIKVAPGNWSIVEPPRVIFDFPETENLSGSNSQQVVVGDLKSINLVQTEKLTRLVLNLYRPTRYSTEISGNVMFIKLESQPIASGAAAAPSTYEPTPVKQARLERGESTTVRDILFRRGEDGQALVLIELTDGTLPVDVRRTSSGLTVELANAELPERLQSKRDVNDFATPVSTVTARSQGGAAKIEIAARGRWFHQAQLANNQLSIEVKPIPADDTNKLVQTGQQGQKVSINFFDADATMILRTLAEISGKNVMIDPSLAGRRVTVTLDNIPYDQALDIVMTQVNAGMRVRNEVVLFGDRAVLLQRDQTAADDQARANDTALLVSETFILSYIKPSELITLVQANIATPAAAPGAGGGGAPAAPAAAAAPQAAGGGRGMLSSRGSISPHDLTKKLFVRDTAAVIEAIREVIRNVDIPQKQVMIEARIVEASTGFTQNLGVRLTGYNYQQQGYQVPGTNTTRMALSTTSTTGNNVDIYGGAVTPALTLNTQMFRPSYSLASAPNIGLMLFNRAATKLISLELQAAETDQKNRTVSAPRIVTMDGKAATINNTQQVTILTGVNATTGLPIYQTFSAPLTLTVTPSINPDNRVSLTLAIAKSTITNANTGSLDTNTVTTNVIVENGGTVVIGGFTRESEVQGQERVPFFGDLPYVGFLFKTTSKVQSRSELLVFITPRIVTDLMASR